MTTQAKKDFHFFGSTCYDWATGATRQEVIEKLAKAGSYNLTAEKVKKHGGLTAVTCKVMAPVDTDYDVNWFMPVGVPIADKVEVKIMNKKGLCTLE